MTVNITINADTLEIYQDGELTKLKAGRTTGIADMYVEKETRDTLAEHKAKTKAAEEAVCAQMDKMTKNWEEQKDKPNSDWIVRRKLKPQSVSFHDSPIRRLTGVYFYRLRDSKEWHPQVFLNSEIFPALSLKTCEILGPITPDMFL